MIYAASTQLLIEINRPPAALEEKPIRTWTVRQKTISLFARKDRFAFSLEGEREKTFRPTLYDIDYATILISMFYRTIGVNLENDEPNSASFLPKLCTSAHSAPDLQVALFGRIDTKTGNELKGMRWGLLDTTLNQEQTFEVNDDDEIVRKFVFEAPNTNRPDDYLMNSYAKRFSIAFKRNEMRRIQTVALHYVSHLDRTVLLSDNTWAVTLVSMMDSTKMCSALFRGKFGHAMLACEGIEQNRPFLRYLHLTKRPKEKDIKLADDEALIEICDVDSPLPTLNGPTWSRSRHLVKNMFAFMAKMKNVPLKFALYGTSFWTKSYSISLIKQAAITMAGAEQAPSEHSQHNPIDRLNEAVHSRMGFRSQGISPKSKYLPQLRYVPMTCFDWACEIGRKGGIILYENTELAVPIEKIRKLQLGNILMLPRGEPSMWLDQPALKAKILSSSALLTHNSSSSDECDAWAREWVIENIKNMSLLHLPAALNAWAIKFPPTESKED